MASWERWPGYKLVESQGHSQHRDRWFMLGYEESKQLLARDQVGQGAKNFAVVAVRRQFKRY